MSIFNPENHLGFLTNRVGRLLSNRMSITIVNNGHDFPQSCIGILADLWQNDGVTQKELGISLIKNKSTISTMLETLQEDGFIYKEVNPDDKRNKRIYLTKKGKGLQKLIEEASFKAESTLLDGCSDGEIETCKKVLRTLYNNLSKQDNNQLQDE